MTGTSWERRPAAVVIALELAGALLILARYILGQLRLLDQHSLVHLILNLAGSAVLAVITFVDARWGFLLLWGTWSIVGGEPHERRAPRRPGGRPPLGSRLTREVQQGRLNRLRQR